MHGGASLNSEDKANWASSANNTNTRRTGVSFFRSLFVYSGSLLGLQAVRQCFWGSLYFSPPALRPRRRLRSPRWCTETSRCFPLWVKRVEMMTAGGGWRLRGYSEADDAPGGRSPPRAWVRWRRRWRWWWRSRDDEGGGPSGRSRAVEPVLSFQGPSSWAPTRSGCSASRPPKAGCHSETASRTRRSWCCAAPGAEHPCLPVSRLFSHPLCRRRCCCCWLFSKASLGSSCPPRRRVPSTRGTTGGSGCRAARSSSWRDMSTFHRWHLSGRQCCCYSWLHPGCCWRCSASTSPVWTPRLPERPDCCLCEMKSLKINQT